MNESKLAAPPTRVSLTVTATFLGRLCLLTGSGFTVRARLGCSVRQLLCGQLGVPTDYLDERIQTIFLNASVVDDPDTAIVAPGSTLALSAAMPGIAGAMLRKGGRYAPMRSQLSHDCRQTALPPDCAGELTIRLFNLLQQELGAEFLRRGIEVPGKAFGDLLWRRPGDTSSGILSADIGGERVEPIALMEMDWANRTLVISVLCHDQSAE